MTTQRMDLSDRKGSLIGKAHMAGEPRGLYVDSTKKQKLYGFLNRGREHVLVDMSGQILATIRQSPGIGLARVSLTHFTFELPGGAQFTLRKGEVMRFDLVEPTGLAIAQLQVMPGSRTQSYELAWSGSRSPREQLALTLCTAKLVLDHAELSDMHRL